MHLSRNAAVLSVNGSVTCAVPSGRVVVGSVQQLSFTGVSSTVRAAAVTVAMSSAFIERAAKRRNVADPYLSRAPVRKYEWTCCSMHVRLPRFVPS